MANKKNTVEIGDNFEAVSLSIIDKLINEDQLPIIEKYAKIYRKKGYYSARRKADIIFDITIEIWPPGAKNYSMIYIIECKNYETRVPVNKIEDFHSKITQVAGVNVKGIFITNSPLQQSAYNFAESEGMMLVQGESSTDYKILLHRCSKIVDIPIVNSSKNEAAITVDIKVVEQFFDKRIRESFTSIIDSKKVSYGIDRLSKEKIEVIAKSHLELIEPEMFTVAKTIDVAKFTFYLRNKFQIEVVTTTDSNSLGSCDIEQRKISISNQISGTNRELFVLAHEFGHFVLHQKLAIGPNLYDVFQDTQYDFKIGKRLLSNPRHWIEWQANYFASSIITPKAVLLALLRANQNLLNMSHRRLFVDNQPQNIRNYTTIIGNLAKVLNVTPSSIIYKLKEMDMLFFDDRVKSVGQIIYENEQSFL